MGKNSFIIQTVLNKIAYSFFGLLLLVFSLGFLIVIPLVSWQNTPTVSEKIFLLLATGVPGGILLAISVVALNKAWMYSEAKEREKQMISAEKALQKAEERKLEEIRKRENNPHLLSELNVSAIGLLVVALGLFLFLILFVLTKDQSYLWGLAIFGAPTLLYSVVSEMEGKRLSENEMAFVNFVIFLFGSIKWISLVAIFFLVISMFVGWINSVPATTIIIILLVLLLFKQNR